MGASLTFCILRASMGGVKACAAPSSSVRAAGPESAHCPRAHHGGRMGVYGTAQATPRFPPRRPDAGVAARLVLHPRARRPGERRPPGRAGTAVALPPLLLEPRPPGGGGATPL